MRNPEPIWGLIMQALLFFDEHGILKTEHNHAVSYTGCLLLLCYTHLTIHTIRLLQRQPLPSHHQHQRSTGSHNFITKQRTPCIESYSHRHSRSSTTLALPSAPETCQILKMSDYRYAFQSTFSIATWTGRPSWTHTRPELPH